MVLAIRREGGLAGNRRSLLIAGSAQSDSNSKHTQQDIKCCFCQPSHWSPVFVCAQLRTHLSSSGPERNGSTQKEREKERQTVRVGLLSSLTQGERVPSLQRTCHRVVKLRRQFATLCLGPFQLMTVLLLAKRNFKSSLECSQC